MAFDSLTQVLDLLRKRYPQLAKRWEESRSLAQWDAAVGPQIARHARAIRVEAGILWVEVDHPVWRAELHARKAQVLQKLNTMGAGKPGESSAPPIHDLQLVSPRRELR